MPGTPPSGCLDIRMNVKIVSNRVAHAGVDVTTLVYGHRSKGQDRGAADSPRDRNRSGARRRPGVVVAWLCDRLSLRLNAESGRQTPPGPNYPKVTSIGLGGQQS
jgi:hypothetical protein